MLTKDGARMPAHDIIMNTKKKFNYYHYPFLLKIFAIGRSSKS